MGEDRARELLCIVSIPFKRDGVSELLGRRRGHHAGCTDVVSIPFKREGVSELSLSVPVARSMHGFYSLQTGRRF